MTGKLPQNRTPLDLCIAELADFIAACGSPSLRQLQTISKQLGQHYGHQYRNLPELTRATLSAILSRQRKTFPTSQWVTSLILSCQRFAWEYGINPQDPGPASLPEWHRRLQAYRTLSTETLTAAPADSAPSQEDDRTSDAEPAQRSDVIALPACADHSSASDNGERGLTLTQQRFQASFGPYGLRLLAAAEDRHDADAAYRIAVLLYLDGRPQEAHAWLLQAHANPQHCMATHLINTDESITQAAEHAYNLGAFAFAGGDYDVAEVYYERAARNGHIDAAFGLGVLFLERRDPPRAAHWFNRAADGGHEYAQARFNDIHRVLLGEAFEPPASDDAESSTSAPTAEDLRRAVNAPEETPPAGLPIVGRP